MSEHKATVREKTREILLRLSEEERRVLSEVLKAERACLHQRRPGRIRQELLKAVRDNVKELPR